MLTMHQGGPKVIVNGETHYPAARSAEVEKPKVPEGKVESRPKPKETKVKPQNKPTPVKPEQKPAAAEPPKLTEAEKKEMAELAKERAKQALVKLQGFVTKVVEAVEPVNKAVKEASSEIVKTIESTSKK